MGRKLHGLLGPTTTGTSLYRQTSDSRITHKSSARDYYLSSPVFFFVLLLLLLPFTRTANHSSLLAPLIGRPPLRPAATRRFSSITRFLVRNPSPYPLIFLESFTTHHPPPFFSSLTPTHLLDYIDKLRTTTTTTLSLSPPRMSTAESHMHCHICSL